MHYHTVNKHLRTIRAMQGELKEVQEAFQRQYPHIAASAQGVRDTLEYLINEILKVEYEH